MDISNRRQLIEYLQSRGLYTKKKLGQNFLVDKEALNKIVEVAELSKDDCVIEVGPGLGTMTEELVKRAGKVIAVELDQVLAELLESRFSKLDLVRRLAESEEDGIKNFNIDSNLILKSKISILKSDILKINIAELTKDCPKYKVAANIPYYITSKIIRYFLESEKKPEMIVLLTQKEVAERICARPGEMSVLSVSVQYYGEPEIIGIVPRTSFFPVPEVDSAILKISNIQKRMTNQQINERTNSSLRSFGHSLSLSDESFFRCVHIGFASRRKTLLNNLSAGYQMDKKSTLDILESAGLNDKTRAQELSVEKWKELCKEISILSKR